jgi:hypothetical protein
MTKDALLSQQLQAAQSGAADDGDRGEAGRDGPMTAMNRQEEGQK